MERYVTSISKMGGFRVPFYLPCNCSCAAMTAIRLLFGCYSIADREHERQLKSNWITDQEQVKRHPKTGA
ncbi:hypothetical protein Y032_0022g530 [Ancylostoma ceylanicum]|nr:hypothetical protein Y032_0022g530 [Ancylostoma ceylanicum]